MSQSSYLRRVRFFKMFLPLSIGIILLFTFMWPSLNQKSTTLAEEALNLKTPNIVENRMVNPHYSSTDDKDQSYTIKAEWGAQVDKQKVTLKSPEGTISLDQKGEMKLESSTGLYDHDEKNLTLDGDVHLHGKSGYDLKTNAAKINLKNKVIESSSAVSGFSPEGTVKASRGFKVTNHPNGKVITLKGRSKVIITPKGQK